MIRFVGIDPAAEKILVVKSSIHYRAAFEPLARAILEVDAPGLSSSNLGRFSVHARATADLSRSTTCKRRAGRQENTDARSRLQRLRLQGLRHEGLSGRAWP